MNEINNIIRFSDSNNEITSSIFLLNSKIKKIQDMVYPLEICRNHTLILGSLEYMSIVMKMSHGVYQKNLLEFVEAYVSKLEGMLINIADFKNLDLNIIEELFDNFQNYVSMDLKIIPRVDDDNFNYADYY